MVEGSIKCNNTKEKMLELKIEKKGIRCLKLMYNLLMSMIVLVVIIPRIRVKINAKENKIYLASRNKEMKLISQNKIQAEETARQTGFQQIIKEQEECIKKLEKITFIIIKRIGDIVCGLVGVLVTIPLAIVTKITYMIMGDFKSIFYIQQRVGKNGKIFNIYKFRSMVCNSEEVIQELLKKKSYKEEWEASQKFENDPRVTKIGKFLRKTSLDEMPQMYNLLKGDMSLIGPRPLVVGELESHNGDNEIYESIKPGISGWWACNGRSTTTYQKRLELEYYYVENMSLKLDVKCIFGTVKSVLIKEGAK